MKKKLRKIILIVLFSVAALFLGLIIYLSISANQMKNVFEGEFSELMDLKCEIRGNIRVRVIPGIKLKIHEIHFSNGKEEVLSAEQVNILLPFSFLFNKRVEILQLDLIRPRLSVSYDRNGKSNWSLIDLEDGTSPADTVKFNYYINLEKVSVKDGSICLSNNSYGDTLQLDQIQILSDTIRFTGSDQGIDWDGSRFTGTLNAGFFQLNSFKLHDLSFSTSAEKKQISIHYASKMMFGGQDKGEIWINLARSPVQINFTYSIKDFNIQQLMAVLEMDTIFSGNMDFETKLSFSGGSVSVFETMHGTVNMEGSGLTLHGYDIDGFLKKFEKSQRFNLIDIGAFFVAGPVGPVVTKGYDFARLLKASKEDSSKVEAFKSHWTIKDGVASANDVCFSTNNNRIAANGEIDFAHSKFRDFTIAVLNEYGCAITTQTINGSFADPKSKGISTFSTMMGPVKNLFKGIFKKKKNCPRFYEGSIPHPVKGN